MIIGNQNYLKKNSMKQKCVAEAWTSTLFERPVVVQCSNLWATEATNEYCSKLNI